MNNLLIKLWYMKENQQQLEKSPVNSVFTVKPFSVSANHVMQPQIPINYCIFVHIIAARAKNGR